MNKSKSRPQSPLFFWSAQRTRTLAMSISFPEPTLPLSGGTGNAASCIGERGLWERDCGRVGSCRPGQSRPQSPRPLDQRSGSAWAQVESKTGTRKSWFRFDSARASEIVVEMNKFQQPMRFLAVFLAGFQSSPEVSIPGAVQKDRGLWGRDCGRVRFLSMRRLLIFNLQPIRFEYKVSEVRESWTFLSVAKIRVLELVLTYIDSWF